MSVYFGIYPFMSIKVNPEYFKITQDVSRQKYNLSEVNHMGTKVNFDYHAIFLLEG